ncbi:MAG: hypothetical protein IJP03_02575 [Christensenellaceae bacterium]|nr:hypothetical protein [Christensenellaceae bacterium]
MKAASMKQMLLFSKELGQSPYRYRLYFAEVGSLASGSPCLHRFVVRSPGLFNTMLPGRVYNLRYRSLFIHAAEETGLIDLTDAQYFDLLDRRDHYFNSERDHAHDGTPASRRYYSFSSMLTLMEYSPPLGRKILWGLIQALAYTLSIGLPILLLLLGTFLFSDHSPKHAYSFLFVPLIVAGLFPLTLWLMNALHQCSQLLLLNVENLRYITLRRYALREGGLRRSCSLSVSYRRKLLKQGAWCLGTFAVITLLSLLLF